MIKKSRIAAMVALPVGLELLRRALQTRREADEAARLTGASRSTDRHLHNVPMAVASDDAGSGLHTGRLGGPDSETDPAHSPGHRHLAPPPADMPAERVNTRVDTVWEPGPLR